MMKQIHLLAEALEYMEENLTSEMKTQDIARKCNCSKSALEKLFRCVNNMTVHDYIIRRRMMKAAQLMNESQERNLLDVALECGYSSNESFTRAFKQVWNCRPSEFRKKSRYSEVFPRLLCPLEKGDNYMMERKHVDISELYDLFVERKNCYFVCCDIVHMMAINDISRQAGDLAIIEALNRLELAAGEHDIPFRIGGDEFVILTASEDIAYAENIAEKIQEKNGNTFVCGDQKVLLSLYTNVVKLENQKLKCDEVFTRLHTAIKENK